MNTTQLTREDLLSKIDELSQRERKMIKLNAELRLRLERSEQRYKLLKNNIKLICKNY